eukprot:TRINITY_DN18196_c0_g1_i1.p1 TRINITY_DN18196_c0_g1~~TRINITY_DN18196_c0_g1_i1.p1  ORF type:complete len:541 (+),score=128.11 TRINITY_DN18196_c0_g1_i1:202-1623(+)
MGNETSGQQQEATTKSPPGGAAQKAEEGKGVEEVDDFKHLGGPVKVIIIGAGSRGRNYSEYAEEFPHRMKVVGVAEPVQFHRNNLAEKHGVPEQFRFNTWEEIQRENIEADAVIIAVQDRLHRDVAVAMAKQKFHILCEKPMAVSLQDCQDIVNAVQEDGVLMGVCHVLRYSPCNREVKRLIESGAIGKVVNIQHLEPVGNWHFAHSYVRGNWRREDESSFSLMTKSCHDLDLLVFWMGAPPTSVQSFGRLSHFKKSEKPEEAKDALRCVECAHEPNCAYSSKQIYLKPFKNFGHKRWPVSIIVEDVTEENIVKALNEGPYGRCVYECDNDVCDHQVVNLEFSNGSTASFTMVAFSQKICVRDTKIYGTKGEIWTDGTKIQTYDFLTEDINVYAPLDVPGDESSKLRARRTHMNGHGYADFYLMDSFIAAVRHNDQKLLLSGPMETLQSHALVFQAEQARRSKQIIDVETLKW